MRKIKESRLGTAIILDEDNLKKLFDFLSKHFTDPDHRFQISARTKDSWTIHFDSAEQLLSYRNNDEEMLTSLEIEIGVYSGNSCNLEFNAESHWFSLFVSTCRYKIRGEDQWLRSFETELKNEIAWLYAPYKWLWFLDFWGNSYSMLLGWVIWLTPLPALTHQNIKAIGILFFAIFVVGIGFMKKLLLPPLRISLGQQKSRHSISVFLATNVVLAVTLWLMVNFIYDKLK